MSTPGKVGPGGTPPIPDATPTPKPIYPDTPWWAVLLAVLITAVVSVMGTAYALGGVSAPSASLPPPASLVVDTITYMPHILLLFGVLGDMFTYQGVYSIPSLVGLLSVFFNYFMQYFWKGLQSLYDSASEIRKVGTVPASTNPVLQRGGAILTPAFFKNYDGCSVQGFESFRTEFAPQTLVVTATIFCYYIFDLVRNRGWINSAASIVIFGVVYIAQTGVLLMTGGCGGPYGNYAQSLMALFEGIVFGGSAYGIVQTYYPTRLPSTIISPFPRKDRSELTMGPDGKMYDADGYPYVVLPNGQAVPDFSTQKSRDAFAEIAGKNLGTGTPAKPLSCSA